jgi:hypothetical protein
MGHWVLPWHSEGKVMVPDSQPAACINAVETQSKEEYGKHGACSMHKCNNFIQP